MAHITLSKEALFYNLDQITTLAPLKKLSVVLKNNAYGHGIEPIATLVAEYGVRHVVVRSVDEALKVADRFESVLVLAADRWENLPSNTAICLYDDGLIEKLPAKTEVHLKVDTGMHRNGIDLAVLPNVLKRIEKRGLCLKGVFTHSRSGDELSSEVFWQWKRFKQVIDEVKAHCQIHQIPNPLFHFANSATLLRFGSEVVLDRVRIGIALYGYHECPSYFGVLPLKPVLRLYAKRLNSRILPKGARIGYGGSGVLAQAGVVSTYDVGYSDGLFRLSAAHEMVFGSTKSIGKMSMDSFSALGDCEELCVIEDANLWAKAFKTINYEILTKLSPVLERRII